MYFQVSYVFLLLLNFCSFKLAIASARTLVHNGEDLTDDIRSILVKLEVQNNDGSFRHLCSGSLLSRSWVITAAHCIKNYYDSIFVVDGTETNRRIIAKADLKDAVRHPCYVLGDKEHDIALLLLKHAMNFPDKKPIPFAAIRPEFGSKAIIAGYGKTEPNSHPPKQGNVKITPCYNCASSNAICSQGLVRTGGGDSGGPIIFEGVLVGVISRTCINFKADESIDMYPSIAENIDWIKSVTKLQ